MSSADRRMRQQALIHDRDKHRIENVAQEIASNLEWVMTRGFDKADIADQNSNLPYNDLCFDLFKQRVLTILSKNLKDGRVRKNR